MRLADQQTAEWPKGGRPWATVSQLGDHRGGTARAAVLLTVLLGDGTMATVHVSVTARGTWQPLHRQLDKSASLRAGRRARWLGARQGELGPHQCHRCWEVALSRTCCEDPCIPKCSKVRINGQKAREVTPIGQEATFKGFCGLSKALWSGGDGAGVETGERAQALLIHPQGWSWPLLPLPSRKRLLK